MLYSFWNRLIKSTEYYTTKFASQKRWEIYLIIALPILGLFFCFPSYDLLFTEFKPFFDILFKQSAHPFTNFHYIPSSHEAKLSFRLFLPVIIHFTHLNVYGVLIFQLITGIITYMLFLKFLSRFFTDKVILIWLSLAFVFIYAGCAAITQIVGYMYDGECILFIMAAMYFRNPVLIGLFVWLTAWNDERGLIATSLVFLWWWFEETAFKDKIVRLTSVITAWLFYFFIRYYLHLKYDLTTPTAGADFSKVIDNINNAPLGIWTALEGFWLLVMVSFLYLLSAKKYVEAFLLCGNYLLIIFIALCVDDITRSMSYMFPAIFISLRTIKKFETDAQLRSLSFWVLFLSFIFPAISACNYRFIIWQYPLPLQLIRIFGQ